MSLTNTVSPILLHRKWPKSSSEKSLFRTKSKVYSIRGDLTQSVTFAQDALSIYDRLSDLVSGARVRSNLAANYLDARRFAEVLTVGAPALDFFVAVQHPHGIAATACNLAEAQYQ